MTPEEARSLADLLRTQRDFLGLSAHEVARRAGVNVGTVTRIEHGEIPNPRPESLMAMARVLQISPSDLFAATAWQPSTETYRQQPKMNCWPQPSTYARSTD
jgi:transcriptional regulator with XRE-family HTH domain